MTVHQRIASIRSILCVLSTILAPFSTRRVSRREARVSHSQFPQTINLERLLACANTDRRRIRSSLPSIIWNSDVTLTWLRVLMWFLALDELLLLNSVKNINRKTNFLTGWNHKTVSSYYNSLSLYQAFVNRIFKAGNFAFSFLSLDSALRVKVEPVCLQFSCSVESDLCWQL